MVGLPPVVIVQDCNAGPFGIASRAEEMVESGISRAACAVRATIAKGRLWCWLASVLDRLPGPPGRYIDGPIIGDGDGRRTSGLVGIRGSRPVRRSLDGWRESPVPAVRRR